AGESGMELQSVLSGTFRTTLTLPEMKVSPSGEPDGTCIQAIPSLTDKLSGTLLIDPIMAHLRTNLSRKTRTRIVYIGNKGSASFVEADAMESTEAEQVVKCLLYLYHAGMYTPLPFFPKASYKFFQTKNISDAESAWEGNMNSKGDAERFGAFFGGEMPSGKLVESLAEAFFGAVVFTGGKGGKA
ncbi:MAG: hypothetical protein IKL85_02370, partial [Lentisphaeria bacterium]|nr:hypothetical protein [Lentisphaeria bacterium]